MKDTRDEIDLLLHIERLAEELNRQMSTRSQFIVRRYPLTFAIVALAGVVAVSEGVKGLLGKVLVLQENPLYMLLIGLFVLLALGSVYKKLNR